MDGLAFAGALRAERTGQVRLHNPRAVVLGWRRDGCGALLPQSWFARCRPLDGDRRYGLRGKISGGGCLDDPRGPRLNALRVVRQPSVDKLPQPGALSRRYKECDVAACRSDAGVEFSPQEASLRCYRSHLAV